MNTVDGTVTLHDGTCRILAWGNSGRLERDFMMITKICMITKIMCKSPELFWSWLSGMNNNVIQGARNMGLCVTYISSTCY